MSIAILTTARSDFGLLKRVIRLAAIPFEVDLLVAGSHFLSSRGETANEVMAEFQHHPRIRIVPIRAMLEDSDASQQVTSISRSQELASRWFQENPCELLLFLGDRWELWGVTLPAFLHGIPLAHISGGEVTEGVIDDTVRHVHTKLSSLHFAAATEYARNISRMGEEDWRICVVGECGLDLIHEGEFATREEVLDLFDVDLAKDTILVTFHPATLDNTTPVAVQIDALLQGLAAFPGHQILFTAPGVEQGSDVVLAAIRSFVLAAPNRRLVEHFGSRNYLAVLRAAKVVVGNSSSGLVEAPSLGTPTVNVGDRQKSRLSAASVAHVGYVPQDVKDAIAAALTPERQALAGHCLNPYDPYRDGRNSQRIVQALEHALTHAVRSRLRAKKFDTEVHPGDWDQLLKESR